MITVISDQTDATQLPGLLEPELTSDERNIEALLIEGLDSGASTPMTAQDWDDIEREAQGIAASEKPARLPSLELPMNLGC